MSWLEFPLSIIYYVFVSFDECDSLTNGRCSNIHVSFDQTCSVLKEVTDVVLMTSYTNMKSLIRDRTQLSKHKLCC